MGYYYTPARGTMEIMRPDGHIMPPSGGNSLPGICNLNYGIFGLLSMICPPVLL